MRLLLVEDDPLIGDAVRTRFARDQHTVEWIKSGDAALAATRVSDFDVVILDLGLPGAVGGLTVLKELRGRKSTTPVLILTARDAVEDRILGLDGGADDYVIKPFDLEELVARARALLRRASGRIEGTLECDGLVLEPSGNRLRCGKTVTELTRHEFMVLQCLMERPGRVVSKAQLEEVIYGWEGGAESNTIEVYISQIRRHIGADRIKTLRGVGYMLR